MPSTSDGKVNVRALAQALELKQTQEKYRYERQELTSLINLVAEGQGLPNAAEADIELAYAITCHGAQGRSLWREFDSISNAGIASLTARPQAAAR